ncbi:rod shape-determining protein MreD [Hylemonella gracilis str. Niagara R]|uniref:Rod shape-determining protein MreD n=1 Tax=Hylemonella gracilis str. Niagara R TaxID=1458275 RepID=A0A016XCX1_9BURK|nr:rod shape-determining protein MreD [Hylemonella gracilis]EYC49760.1 rod shape-determining protein MreD [Hylemonella gracilis str. Niagara R]
MMLRAGQQLLLPAKPVFIWGSLVAALALSMLGNFVLWGRASWAPDLLALTLVFWGVHQPRRIGMTGAFLFGLLMDVHQGSVLGQHALAYSVLSFFAIAVHRRILWFPVSGQTLQVLPILAAAHVVTVAVRMMLGGQFPGWSLLMAPLIEALLWPVATLLLLLPQRRAPDPDANRPI